MLNDVEHNGLSCDILTNLSDLFFKQNSETGLAIDPQPG